MLPTIARTDLIVGFPGETDKNLMSRIGFCRQMGFSKMHVFSSGDRTSHSYCSNQVDQK